MFKYIALLLGFLALNFAATAQQVVNPNTTKTNTLQLSTASSVSMLLPGEDFCGMSGDAQRLYREYRQEHGKVTEIGGYAFSKKDPEVSAVFKFRTGSYEVCAFYTATEDADLRIRPVGGGSTKNLSVDGDNGQACKSMSFNEGGEYRVEFKANDKAKGCVLMTFRQK